MSNFKNLGKEDQYKPKASSTEGTINRRADLSLTEKRKLV